MVAGYKAGSDIDLAMERGELDGRCGTHLTSFKALHPGWFAERKILVPVIIAERRRADLPDTPAMMEFVKDEATRQQLELMMVAQNMDRPVLAPPGVPAERVTELRAALAATMADPAFRADIEKRSLHIDPMRGADMAAAYARAFAFPPEIIAAVRDVMGGGSSRAALLQGLLAGQVDCGATCSHPRIRGPLRKRAAGDRLRRWSTTAALKSTNVPPRSSSMWMRTISSNELSALKPSSRARRASMRCGQPVDDARDQRIVLAADARGDALAGDAPQRRDLLGDGAAHAGHGEIDARAERVARKPAACTRKPTAARGLAWVCTTVSDTGSAASSAGQRLADDAGEETRSRLVRLARPHHDARQPDADAVAEAAPGVVGEQRFADRLLRAVGGERREMKVVGDRLRERRAEHRDRGGVDEPRPIAVAGRADRLEQRTRAVEIDAIALVEIELGFAGHHAGEMEDRIGPARDGPRRLARRGKIGGHRSRSCPAKLVGFAGGTTSSSVSLSIGWPLSPPSLTSRSVSLRPIMPAAPVTRICTSFAP